MQSVQFKLETPAQYAHGRVRQGISDSHDDWESMLGKLSDPVTRTIRQTAQAIWLTEEMTRCRKPRRNHAKLRIQADPSG